MPRFGQLLTLSAAALTLACQVADASPSLQQQLPPARRSPGRRALVSAPTPCPKEMAVVGNVCVDRWEAHLVVLAGAAARVHPHTQRPPSGERYAARSAPGMFPQAYISRMEAAGACAAAGKRLCSLGEWYRACRGSSRGVYPWGQTASPGRCNSGKPHLLSKLFGRDARRWTLVSHFNSPLLNAEPGYLAQTGQYDGCRSDLGTHDMVGNLHEWVTDVVDERLASKLPVLQDILDKVPINRGNAIFMGGFYSTIAEHGEGCTFLTPGHQASYHDYSTGFRCCKATRAAARE